MEWILVGILILASLVTNIVIEVKRSRREKKTSKDLDKKFESLNRPLPPPQVQVDVDTTPVVKAVNERLSLLPEQITNSITGSSNIQKGKLGELIGYLQMKAEYDRIIPLGTIVDFMAIKLPTKDNPGYVDLIDIKTGSGARLTQDQRKLRDLIASKQINFKTIKIDNIEGLK